MGQEAITLLPMFPHSLNARTLITSQEKQIKLIVRGKTKAFLSMDSHRNLKVAPDEEVLIRRANTELTLIHPTDHSFFSSCRDKLGWSLGCLLYTSPSPRDAHESRMPSSA